MPVTSLLDLQLKPEGLEESFAILSRVLVDTRAFDGCLGVTVVQDSNDPAHVIAIESWESLEHDAAYRAWRAGPGASAELAGIVAAMPRLAVCETLAGV